MIDFEKTPVNHSTTHLVDGAPNAIESPDLPPEAELFAQLASQATEALLLSHRAVLIAEAKLAARVCAAAVPGSDIVTVSGGTALAGLILRVDSDQAAAGTPARPRQRLRERFGLHA